MSRINDDGQFESDKYPPCGGGGCGRPHSPPGYLVLKFSDVTARLAIARYAKLIERSKPGLFRDLHTALANEEAKHASDET